jgi:hypothetical protein
VSVECWPETQAAGNPTTWRDGRQHLAYCPLCPLSSNTGTVAHCSLLTAAAGAAVPSNSHFLFTSLSSLEIILKDDGERRWPPLLAQSGLLPRHRWERAVPTAVATAERRCGRSAAASPPVAGAAQPM